MVCLLGIVDQVAACEPLPCEPGYLLPSQGMIPENGPPILWIPVRGYGWPQPVPTAKPTALLKRDGTKVATHIGSLTSLGGYLVRAKSGWKQGERYELKADNRCQIGSGAHLFSTFSISPPAPTPTKLGRLTASPLESGLLKVGTDIGSCSVKARAVWVDVNLTLDQSSLPWEAVFEYETLVDGKKWLVSDSINTSPIPGSSWVGRGRDRIYTLCDPKSGGFEGVAKGAHEIVLRGRVLGHQDWFQSDPVSVVLRCLAN